MDQARISRCIEAICEKGCVEVTAVIQMLDAGNPIPEAADLSDTELASVLRELKAIMAVYEGKQS